MKKLRFLAYFILLSLSFSVFGQLDAPPQMRMIFSDFKIPFICRMAGLHADDFSKLSIFIDLSSIKDRYYGSPIITSIDGVQMQGAKPRFTQLGLDNYYGYITVPAPITMIIRENTFRVEYISIQKLAVVGSIYKGSIRLLSDNNRSCTVHIVQSQ